MTTEALSVIGRGQPARPSARFPRVPRHGPGYQRLLVWMREHGPVRAIEVESTGSFGATLTRALTKAGERVVEVNRPNRLARHGDGKSDRLDAEQIARAVLSQTSTAIPKTKSGTVEVIRTLCVTRASAVKARTRLFNTLWGVVIGAPSPSGPPAPETPGRTSSVLTCAESSLCWISTLQHFQGGSPTSPPIRPSASPKPTTSHITPKRTCSPMCIASPLPQFTSAPRASPRLVD